MKTINNRYHIIKKLGEGGMGEIYLADDKLYEKPVALKTIRQEIAKQETIDRFKVEFEVMTRLKHPNLAQVYDFGFDAESQNYFITMEYVEGVNLKKWLEAQSPQRFSKPLGAEMDIFVALLRAIEFIHSRKILHRDIKPENIMIIQTEYYNPNLRTSYSLKVMDFGLADLSKGEKAKTKGTLLYLAPEVFSGNVDQRTDIFSLGVTLYNLIVQDVFYGRPINTKTISDILKDERKFEQTQLVALGNLENSDLKDIVGKMTAFKPENRYGSCTEIIADINEKLGKEYPLETKSTKQAYVLGAGFVGRDAEMNRLINWLDSADGQRKLLRVYGEAGIGKSRLFAEFKHYCQLRNIKFLQSDSKEIGQRGFGTFLPIINEMLLDSSEKMLQQHGSQLKKLLPEHPILKGIQPAPKQDAKTERGILIQSITDFIMGYAAEFSGKESENNVKIVLFLNDLHWTDNASVEALEELMYKLQVQDLTGFENLLGLRVYVSSRPRNLEKLDKIKAKDRLTELELNPFEEKNVKSYIQAVFGEEKIDDSLNEAIPQINSKVGGNPYFLQELIKSLVNLNLIERKKSAWVLTKSIEKAKLPGNLKELIQSHLKQLHLSENEWRILEILSLINYPPTFEELNQIQSFERNLLNELDRLEVIKIESEKGEIHYRTAHDLIRTVIIEQIDNRPPLHELIAEKLEMIHEGNLDEYIAELAYHYAEAEHREKALFYLEKACNAAKANYQNQQAIELFDKLLDMLGEHQPKKKVDTYLKKADVLRHIGEWEKSESYFDKAIELATSIGDEKLLADGKRKKAVLLTSQSKYEETIALLNEAKSVYERLDMKGRISDIYNNIGGVYHYQSDYDTAHKYYEKAVDYAQRVNDQGQISLAMVNIAFVHLHKANYDKALEIFKEHGDLLAEHGDQLKYAQVIGTMGSIHMFQGNYDEAIASNMKFLDVSKKLGNKHNIAVAFGNAGLAYMYQSEHEKAKDYFQRALVISQELNDRKNIASLYGNLGIVYKEMKKLDKAMEYYQKDLEISRELNNKSSACTVLINISVLYEIKGELQKAIDYCKEAIEIAEEIGEPRLLCAALGNLAGNYKRRGDYEKAEELYDRSLAITKKSNIQYYYSAYLQDKADLYFILEKFDEAEKLNQQAMEIAGKINAQGVLFESKILSAKLLFVRKERETAIQQLKEMLSEWEESEQHGKLHYELFMMFTQLPKLSETNNVRLEKHRRAALEYYEDAYQKTPNLLFKKYLKNLRKPSSPEIRSEENSEEPILEQDEKEDEEWEDMEDSFM